MMMQSRRREHGSSSELDVFGATNYFAALPPAAPDDDCPSSTTEPSMSADRLYFQAKVQRDTTTRTTEDNDSFRGPAQQQQQQLAGSLHDHAERHASNKQLQVVAAAKRLPSSSGKSKSMLAAILSFMVLPSSPRASFRKEINYKEAPSTNRLRKAEAPAAGGGEREPADTYKATAASSSSSRESSVQLQSLFGTHDDDELDLGVATGDRRLQGITVMRGIGDVERWVVRCVPGGAWDDEEHREKILDAAESASSSKQNIKDELVEVEQAGDDDDDGDSNSSSDLFDLDLEYR